jgi:phosphoglucosamine mutase
MRADAGIVISASHNPFQDNGIKVFSGAGRKLSDDEEAELESLILDESLNTRTPAAEFMGRARRIEDARGRYIQFMKTTFPRDLKIEGMEIAVDVATEPLIIGA